MEHSSKKDLIVTLSVLLAVVFIVTGVIVTKKKPVSSSPLADISNATSASLESTNPNTNTSETTGTSGETVASNVNSSGFKDGTYTATGRYATPEDTESITVTVTLKDGTITDTSATSSPHSRESREYISAFIDGYKSMVVGKSISSLKLGRVSGSSLTTQGFNSAIAAIETQAKS